MRLLAIDPGGRGNGTTGWVYLVVPDDGPPALVGADVISGGFEGFLDADLPIPTTWVVEDFIPRGGIPLDPVPLQIIGALRERTGDAVIRQAPSYRKVVTNDVLKRLGLWDLPHGNHDDCRQAAKHAVAYLRGQHHIPTLRAGWPNN